MKKKNSFFYLPFLLILIFCDYNYADSYKNNFYNNHGIVGLINTPTARLYNESVHGIIFYDGTPDQKITLSSNPYDWLEASFFYTNIQGLPYPGFEFQDYKDKGFNVKFQLKKEGLLPAIAIGFNDFAGTGFYGSEYIVSSYGIKNVDLHLGIGWGQLSGTNKTLKNPFVYASEAFRLRSTGNLGTGTLDFSQFFSGEKASPFFGISYQLKNNLFFLIEKDTTLIDGPRMPYTERQSDYSLGFNYNFNDRLTFGASYERGSFFSFKFIYKNDPKNTIDYKYQKSKNINENDSKYSVLIKNLEQNGIGVNKISETSRSLGLELTQFIHSDMALVEQIIKESSRESGITKNIIKDIKIADLDAVNEIDESFERRAKIIYERETKRAFNTNTGLRFQPFLASREEFFKGAFLIENNSEIILKENLFFNVNLKYSIANNFDDLRFPPVDTFPAQVRSDIKQYLKNMDDGVLIGRAQLDYHYSHNKHNHFMLTGGILEDMFSGYGAEYLYFKPNNNYSLGFEVFHAQKRDYDWGFGHLDYKNTTYSANLYYRNYGLVPFDMKLSFGEYLAGDKGSSIEFSRRFKSGVNFGIFATFTDVSSEDFGEGSFDKGIFFNIPIYGNFINYTWRPLTKDPGAKLIRRNSLYDLLVKFQPIN